MHEAGQTSLAGLLLSNVIVARDVQVANARQEEKALLYDSKDV